MFNHAKRVLSSCFFAGLLICQTAISEQADDNAQAHNHGDNKTGPTIQSNSDFFDTMANVLTGSWEGRYTNGTFDQPSEWMPVKVEYRLTSRGSALVEDYLYGSNDVLGMTTVYHKDNADLRLTHYCGAMNHPSMLARKVDRKARTVSFDFTGITNLDKPESYHSRQFELNIVADDHVRITYHGLENGRIASQAYDLRRTQ